MHASFPVEAARRSALTQLAQRQATYTREVTAFLRLAGRDGGTRKATAEETPLSERHMANHVWRVFGGDMLLIFIIGPHWCDFCHR